MTAPAQFRTNRDIVFHASTATLCPKWRGHRVGVPCPACGRTPGGRPAGFSKADKW